MKLKISGLDTAPVRFKHLFGIYPYGFKPWQHCIKCLVHRRAGAIFPEMKDTTVELEDRLFYLCGVGQDTKRPDHEPRATNVHLAVRPRAGSVASIGSVYGVTFTIEDAQAIPIAPVSEGFRKLPDVHTRCKNFQFAHQLFKDDGTGEESNGIVWELREDWKSVPLAT